MGDVKPVFKFLIVILLFLVVEIGGFFYGYQPSDLVFNFLMFDKDKNKVEEKYSIRFKFKIDESEYPAFWGDSTNGKNLAVGVDDELDASRFYSVVRRELKKYPKVVLREELNHIYALDSLVIRGLSAGGTYDPVGKGVYIKVKREGGHVSKNYIGKVFHHEFSSVLAENHQFSEKEWRLAFDEGFSYKSEEDPFYYIITMQGNADEISDEELFSRGLLEQYAETGVENDFNTYAEAVFTEPSKMKKLIAQHPVIKRKYEVFKAFYLSIDKGFAPVFKRIDG